MFRMSTPLAMRTHSPLIKFMFSSPLVSRCNSHFAFFFTARPLPPLPSLTPASAAHFPPTIITLPSATLSDSDSLCSPTRLSLSDGSEDQLDRLQQVELARTTPMSQWRAGTVQAWLEVVMAMPMYIRSCSENVKSGKVGQHLCSTSSAAAAKILAFCRFCSGWLMKTWSWV